jgi:hypothetical protein
LGGSVVETALSDSLFALGVSLMEIGLDIRLDNLETFSPEILRDTMFPGLINDLSESSGFRFARAVQLCFSSGFGEALTGDAIREIREILYEVVLPLETILQAFRPFPFDIFSQNMGLLAYAEAPEDITTSIRRLKEAFLKFYPEQLSTMRVEEIREITEEIHVD